MGRPKKNPGSAVAVKKVHILDGLTDVVSEANPLWDAILKKFSKMSRVYGFSRIEAPLVEDSALYGAVLGSKAASQLVAFPLGDKQAALRPAMLPGVLRSYVQGKIFDQTALSKWCYSGFTVRHQPDGKKLLQDYEFGFEVFGNFNHLTEAQVVGVVWEMLTALGLSEMVLEINNIGKSDCQAAYQETLQDFLSSKKYSLCDDCNDYLQGRVLNVFRCGNLDCQAIFSEAPTILDFLDTESHKHFTNILEALDELRIPYQLNPLYAGPEGHSKTNFVIKYKTKGESVVIGEGGYHDQILERIGGKSYCSFGFTGSFNAILGILEESKVIVARDFKNDVFLVPLGELASKKSLRLFRDLTLEKVSVYDHFGSIGVKNQLKQAETYKASIALIMGQKEAMDEMVILRDVKSGMQEIISYDKIVEEVKKRLGR